VIIPGSLLPGIIALFIKTVLKTGHIDDKIN